MKYRQSLYKWKTLVLFYIKKFSFLKIIMRTSYGILSNLQKKLFIKSIAG